MLPDNLHPPSLSPATHPLPLIFQPLPPYPGHHHYHRSEVGWSKAYAVMAGPSVARYSSK